MPQWVDEFQDKLPRGAVATNIHGAYALSASAGALDIARMSATDLHRHGIFWARPEDGDHGGLRDAWRNAFARPWERVVPIMTVPRIVPARSHSPLVLDPLRDTSKAGRYCPDPFTRVDRLVAISGTWTVPHARKPSAGARAIPGSVFIHGDPVSGWDSSVWIGLGGIGGAAGSIGVNLLQGGVRQYVLATGETVYVAWYEWLVSGNIDPNKFPYVNQTETDLVIRPGDVVIANVQYDGQIGSVSLGNQTTGKGFTMLLLPPSGPDTPPFTANSAEWIVEAPNGGSEFGVFVPDLDPVTFTNAITCGAQPEPLNPSSLTARTLTLTEPSPRSTHSTVQIGDFTETVIIQ